MSNKKSDFIVNLTSDGLQKLVTVYLFILCAFIPVAGLIYYINEKLIYSSAAALTFLGFLGFLFFLIAILKKEIVFKGNLSYPLIFMLLALSSAAAFLAIDHTLSVYGNNGRNEGILAIVAYTAIFLASTVLYKNKAKLKICDLLIAVGIIQSVLGILQHIPALEDTIPSFYNYFRLTFKVFLSDGVTGSPMFLGTLLSLISGISISGAVYDKSKTRRIIYGIATILFAVTAFFTSSIIPLIGISSAFITICIIEIIRILKGHTLLKGNLLSNSIGRLGVVFVCFVIVTLTIIFTEGIELQDQTIIGEDGFYRLYIIGPSSVVDETPLYEHMWSEGLSLIKENPVFGVGPDCISKALYGDISYNAGTIDRPYNEYLYIAMSRGIPALFVYLALIVFTIRRAFGGIKRFYQKSETWVQVAFTSAIIAYIIQAFFNMSSITVAPYFWIILGLIWSKRQSIEKK